MHRWLPWHQWWHGHECALIALAERFCGIASAVSRTITGVPALSGCSGSAGPSSCCGSRCWQLSSTPPPSPCSWTCSLTTRTTQLPMRPLFTGQTSQPCGECGSTAPPPLLAFCSVQCRSDVHFVTRFLSWPDAAWHSAKATWHLSVFSLLACCCSARCRSDVRCRTASAGLPLLGTLQKQRAFCPPGACNVRPVCCMG